MLDREPLTEQPAFVHHQHLCGITAEPYGDTRRSQPPQRFESTRGCLISDMQRSCLQTRSEGSGAAGRR